MLVMKCNENDYHTVENAYQLISGYCGVAGIIAKEKIIVRTWIFKR